MEFFDTMAGHRFASETIPNFVEQLAIFNKNMKENTEMMSKRMELMNEKEVTNDYRKYAVFYSGQEADYVRIMEAESVDEIIAILNEKGFDHNYSTLLDDINTGEYLAVFDKGGA